MLNFLVNYDHRELKKIEVVDYITEFYFIKLISDSHLSKNFEIIKIKLDKKMELNTQKIDNNTNINNKIKELPSNTIAYNGILIPVRQHQEQLEEQERLKTKNLNSNSAPLTPPTSLLSDPSSAESSATTSPSSSTSAVNHCNISIHQNQAQISHNDSHTEAENILTSSNIQQNISSYPTLTNIYSLYQQQQQQQHHQNQNESFESSKTEPSQNDSTLNSTQMSLNDFNSNSYYLHQQTPNQYSESAQTTSGANSQGSYLSQIQNEYIFQQQNRQCNCNMYYGHPHLIDHHGYPQEFQFQQQQQNSYQHNYANNSTSQSHGTHLENLTNKYLQSQPFSNNNSNNINSDLNNNEITMMNQYQLAQQQFNAVENLGGLFQYQTSIGGGYRTGQQHQQNTSSLYASSANTSQNQYLADQNNTSLYKSSSNKSLSMSNSRQCGAHSTSTNNIESLLLESLKNGNTNNNYNLINDSSSNLTAAAAAAAAAAVCFNDDLILNSIKQEPSAQLSSLILPPTQTLGQHNPDFNHYHNNTNQNNYHPNMIRYSHNFAPSIQNSSKKPTRKSRGRIKNNESQKQRINNKFHYVQNVNLMLAEQQKHSLLNHKENMPKLSLNQIEEDEEEGADDCQTRRSGEFDQQSTNSNSSSTERSGSAGSINGSIKTSRFKDLLEPCIDLTQPNVTTIMQRPVDMGETKRYKRKNLEDLEKRRTYSCTYEGKTKFY